MDATNGVPGRPLNWLPSGLTALILSLERTDSLAFKSFSVSQVVKSLLSLKNKPHKEDSRGFRRSDSLTKYGMYLSGFPLAPNSCQCEDLCECCGCGEPYCSVCEPEEYFEYEDHHELQYQWGFPLAGSLVLNGPNSCASDAYFRREPRFASKKWANVQDFSWARPLERRAAFRERECVSGKIVERDGQDSKGVGEKSPSMRSANVAPRSKDDAGQVSDNRELGGGSILNKKAEASPQRSSEATDSETQKSHATLKPSHNTTAHGV